MNVHNTLPQYSLCYVIRVSVTLGIHIYYFKGTHLLSKTLTVTLAVPVCCFSESFVPTRQAIKRHKLPAKTNGPSSYYQ